jgi:hypothetical protein
LAKDLLQLNVMKRRLLSFVLLLSLGVLAPMPVSACALLMEWSALCNPNSPSLDAPGMECPHSAPSTTNETIESAPGNCCEVSGGVLPEADVNPSKTKSAVAPLTAAAEHVSPFVSGEHSLQTEETIVLPQDRQALLCVFLA